MKASTNILGGLKSGGLESRATDFGSGPSLETVGLESGGLESGSLKSEAL